MGFTVGLVRNVFSRNHAIRSHERKIMRRNSSENRRWISVKSYLCGNEFNSVLAEEDSASIKSSEVTVTQSIQEDLLSDKGETRSEETVENIIEKNTNSNSKSLNEEEAAIIIQSAYRSFKLRCKNEEIIRSENEEKLSLVTESPDRKSMATSVEVQTGNSIEIFSLEGEKLSIYNRIQNRNRTRAIKQKEDWDDSTVSSNVSKMRMQNRMEASTRRERALAYAFSQQLRICSKRKLAKHENNMEQNMSWSWLERWMATRLQDTSSVESHAMNQYENFNTDDHHKFTIKTRFLDASGGEEKESCGSNEVPLHFDNYSINSQDEKVSNFKLPTKKTNFKARRTVSRRKTVPSYQFHDENPKVSIKDGSSNGIKDIKQKQKQDGSKTEISQMTISTPKTSNE
ncbi:protein IQ-DOMAIN [Trifolium repens]|nr:protein IQ-DOMAIN [Trifolium repens]